MLEKVQDWAESEADYSLNSSASFARWDQDSLCWKTSQRCLLEGWETFSGRWPRSGTMRNGIAYRLRPLVGIQDETDFSLLPTVTVNGNYNRTGLSATSGDGFATKMKELNGSFPTPQMYEIAMDFPPGWTELEGSETQ